MLSAVPWKRLAGAVGLVVVVLSAWMNGCGAVSGEKPLRMAGQAGMAALVLEKTGAYLAAAENRENAAARLQNPEADLFSVLRGADCCAAATPWALGADRLDGALMCPDAAAKFLKTHPEFVSLGPALINSDVLVVSGEIKKGTGSFKIGVAHKRSHQLKMVERLYGKTASPVPMLPAALPYALKRGDVDAAIMDLAVATASGLPIRPWTGPPVVTQELVIKKDFFTSPAFPAFVSAYTDACADIQDQYPETGLIIPLLHPRSP